MSQFSGNFVMATAVAKKETTKNTGAQTPSNVNMIQTDSDAFTTALSILTSQSSSISTCKSNYQKSMDAMMATWQGASASALAGAIEAIANQMDVVINGLEALQGQLTCADTTFQSTDKSSSQLFTGSPVGV